MLVIERENVLKDVLYYTQKESGASLVLAQGVLMGVVSTIIATGHDYQTAILLIKDLLPVNYRPDAIPEAWRDSFTLEA